MGKLVLGLWVVFVLGVFSKCIVGFEHFNLTELRFESLYGVSAASAASNPLVVDLTLIQGAADQGADFFNWNRVKLRYCDGASFAGDGEDKAAKLEFKGQRIWSAAMEELMSRGMHNANQALLSGCSAGGLASILHCDEFRDLFPGSTKVKCLSDAGLFLDA
ncbi:hypothetical protein C3L33_22324, partial [Rhododendron williamsianum]